MVKQATKEAFVLILAAVAMALAVYAVRPDKIGLIPAADNEGAVQQSPSNSGFSEISIGDAVRLYEEKSAIFADSRHTVDYEAGHIKGAVHLYMADREIWLSDFLTATDPATVIVTYCDGEDCHLAPELAELLFFNGFENVYYLTNGWTRWRDGGFAVE
ncbi:MAG: rhodanese-like domain-containing protein [Desulfosarcina sp.]|nr:rhodanese-like domain-containing protein [Desulfosarcina sp.]MBC2744023.1 rhodanese-like domain-containing protein [Desulfosarcina sp.]MBC2766933.1 rhodanese-like domain-containing protein [Desulfosarcina sp.]